MLWSRSLLVVSLLASLSLSKPLRARVDAPNGTKPYWNLTSISTSPAAAAAAVATAVSSSTATIVTPSSWTSSSSAAKAPYPIIRTGTGITTTDSRGRARPTDQGTIGTSGGFPTRKNDTVAPCTVNVPSATIDWWFAATYAWPAGSFSTMRGSNYTEVMLSFIPNTDTLDISSALATDLAYTDTLVYDPEWDMTWTYLEEYTVRPSATVTSVITRTTVLPLPSDGIIPATDFLYYEGSTVLPASKAILGAANKTAYAATSTTPVLYFSAYEVETAVPYTAEDGRVRSSISTKTFSLTEPFALPYWLKGIEDQATATGPVPDEFLQSILQASCAPGNVVATVEVLFVVDVFYSNFPGANPFIVHIESSALGWDLPDPETETDNVHAENTGKGQGQPMTMRPIGSPQSPASTMNVPIIQPTAKGFSSAPAAPGSINTPTPQGQPSSASHSNSGGGHNAGGNPGQGPNVAEPSRQTVGTIGTNPVVVAPSSVVIVGSQTLKPGQPAITVGGVPVSLAPSGSAIVVGGKTSSLPQVAFPVSKPRPAPILTIGSSTLTGNAATQFFISSGQILTPGGTAIVDGTTVSLAPSASFIVVGGSTQILPTAAPAPTSPPQIVVGGTTFTADSSSHFVINGQTLAPGQAITVDGTSISLAPSASFAVVGGSTQVFPTAATAPSSPPQIVVGGTTFTADSSSQFIIDGQTLAPGQAITADGTTISLAPSASFAVIDGSTQIFPTASSAPEIVVGGSTFIGNSDSTFVINGQTLAPGQQITVDGTTVSLGPSGSSFVVVNGATTTVANAAAHITAPPLTIGNSVFTALPGDGTTYQIGSYLLTPGGAITIGDTTISLAPGATALIINGQTTMLDTGPITNAPLLTIGSQTFTADHGTTFIIDGQTLTPGGSIIVDGTTISLAPGATQLVFGSSGHSTTETLFPATTTRSPSLTTTNTAEAGATGQNSSPSETNSKGVGHMITPCRLDNWALSLFIAFFGMGFA